jgi:hypothetical protein
MFPQIATVNPAKLKPIRPILPAATVDDVRCPECGGEFTIDPDAEVGEQYVPRGFAVRDRELPIRMRRATVAFCSGCEFCVEIR